MIIHEISLYNFGVYAGPETIKPCNGATGGKTVTLIGGINGGGKTTIIEAVLLVLYGKNSSAVFESGQHYQKYISSYIREGTTEAWLELVLDIPVQGRAVNIRLRRRWSKKKNNWHEKLVVFRDGVNDLFLGKNWSYYVEDLIPSGLAGLFFFDGEKIVKWAEEDTGESMKKAIYNVFGIDLIDRLIHDMGRLIKKHEACIYPPGTEKEIQHLESSGQSLLDELTIIRQELASIETKLERMQEKARQKEMQIIKSGGHWEDEKENLTIAREETKGKMASLNTEMIGIANSSLPLVLVKPLLKLVHEQLIHDHSAKLAAQALPLLNEQANIVFDLLSNQGLDENILKQLKVILSMKERALKDQAKSVSTVYVSELGLGQIEQLINTQLKDLSDQAYRLVQEYLEVERRREHIESHLLVDIDNNTLEQDMKTYKELQEEITELSVQKKFLSERLFEKNNEFINIEKKYKDYIKRGLIQIDETEESARIIKYALQTQENMKLYRQKLLEHKTVRLSSSLENAFMHLAHKKSLVDHVKLDPDTLSIFLFDQVGREIPKERLSAGEKQMIAIALLWGLAESSGRMLPVIIDTPLGRLDSAHRQNFISRYLPNASHQVIVLSTDTEINGKYYKLLEEHIGVQYRLDFSDQNQNTVITEGYFPSVIEEGERNDHPASQAL